MGTDGEKPVYSNIKNEDQGAFRMGKKETATGGKRRRSLPRGRRETSPHNCRTGKFRVAHCLGGEKRKKAYTGKGEEKRMPSGIRAS